jgi:hypothetical protein
MLLPYRDAHIMRCVSLGGQTVALVDDLWLAAVAGIRDPALRMIVQILDDRTKAQNRALRRLAEKMTSVEEVQEALDTVTTDLANRWEEIEAINAQLREAVLAGEQQRAQQLAEQAEAYSNVVNAGVAKLRDIGTDAENPVPDPEPLPEPAPLPGGGDASEPPSEPEPAPDGGDGGDGTAPVDAPPPGSTGPGDLENPGDLPPGPDGDATAPDAPDTGTVDPGTGTAGRRGR